MSFIEAVEAVETVDAVDDVDTVDAVDAVEVVDDVIEHSFHYNIYLKVHIHYCYKYHMINNYYLGKCKNILHKSIDNFQFL